MLCRWRVGALIATIWPATLATAATTLTLTLSATVALSAALAWSAIRAVATTTCCAGRRAGCSGGAILLAATIWPALWPRWPALFRLGP